MAEEKKKDRSRWTEREWIAHHKKVIEGQDWSSLDPDERLANVEALASRYDGKIPGSLSEMLDARGEKLHLPYVMKTEEKPLNLEGRTAAKAFPDDPEQALKVLRGLNPDVIDLRLSPDGRIRGRLKGENFERVMDPGGLANLMPGEMVEDVKDVSAELYDALGSYLFGKGGSMLGVKGGPIGMAAGEAIGSGAGSYYLEGLRQDLANYYNMSNKPRDVSRQQWAAGMSALPGGALAAKGLASKLANSGFVQRQAPAIGIGLGSGIGGYLGQKFLGDAYGGVLGGTIGGAMGREIGLGIQKKTAKELAEELPAREIAEKQWADLTRVVPDPTKFQRGITVVQKNPYQFFKPAYETGLSFIQHPSLANKDQPR